MWPFRKRKIEPLFPGVHSLIGACKAKDADLYSELQWLSPSMFWREWQKTYPEDFPDGDLSIAGAHCVTPKQADD